MNSLYTFLAGPGLWIAAIVCAGGLVVRLAFLTGLSRGRDAVFYNHASFSWGARSVLYWLAPYATITYRKNPVFTAFFFGFHVPLILVPVFLSAHNELFSEAFGFCLPVLPDRAADALTILLLISAAGLLVRRLLRPEVRALSSAWDYALLVLTALPFATGFAAARHLGPYSTLMVLHLASAEALLIIIPFSKLGHVALFFATRAFAGFEMGKRRGARAW